MNQQQANVSRRGFLKGSTAIAGAAVLSGGGVASAFAAAGKRTAVDQVPLNKTGILLSRLGIGTGSMNGELQRAVGKDDFAKLIHYAFDKGITYIDTAEQYQTFDWIADAMKVLPREKIFLQSKIPGQPADILARIDHHRSVFKTDYIDSLLVHCMVQPDWTDKWKRIMEGFDKAKEKKWIRAKGVSCHTLPALQAATKEKWCEVHLVRVNPQGRTMDGPILPPGERGRRRDNPVDPVLKEIQLMHEDGRGVIGMKICGNGSFTDVADREKSVRFAMNNPNIDAVVIGMVSREQVDENIAMIDRALAES